MSRQSVARGAKWMECLSYTVHVYLTIVQVSSQAHIHQPPPDRTKEEFAFILYEYNVFTFSQLESMEKKKVKTVTWEKKKKYFEHHRPPEGAVPPPYLL